MLYRSVLYYDVCPPIMCHDTLCCVSPHALPYSAVLYCTVLYCTVLYYTSCYFMLRCAMLSCVVSCVLQMLLMSRRAVLFCVIFSHIVVCACYASLLLSPHPNIHYLLHISLLGFLGKVFRVITLHGDEETADRVPVIPDFFMISI